MDRRTLIINSTVLFLLAAILEMTLRECGRCIAAVSVYAKPVLFHNYVSYNLENNSLSDKIFCASVGPVVNLIMGVYSHLILKNRFESRFTILFFIYLSVFGYTRFFGGIMLSAFFPDSDIGYILTVWDYPRVFMALLGLISIPILYLLIKSLARYFVSLMSKRTAADPGQRKEYISALIIKPWLIGSLVLTILNLPAHSLINIISPLLFPAAIILPYSSYLTVKAKNNRYDRYETLTLNISYFWLTMLVIAIIMNRIMATGITFG